MSTAFKDLGFVKEESKEIVSKLNTLLANYQIHYQKLRNFHWNVKGADFFDIHEQFEQEYNEVKLQIDEIAERIRTFGATPYSTLASYLEHADIKESPTDLHSDHMVKEILSDFTMIMSYLIDAIEESNESGDIGTADMLTKYLKRTEKRHWMLNAFITKQDDA